MTKRGQHGEEVADDGITKLGGLSQRVPKRRQVFCRTAFDGLHCWPDAPPETGFLRYPHRHMFGVEVTVDVTHSDRDVEFLALVKIVDDIILLLKGEPWECDGGDGYISKDLDDDILHWSCERWAEEIGTVLLGRGYDVYTVQVVEDSQNGAVIRW